MKNELGLFLKKYPMVIGLLISVINGILLFSFLFTGLLKEAIYFGYQGGGLATIVIYGGSVYISFLFSFFIQITYEIKKSENGFLFWILCVCNLLELFILLYFLSSYEEITNMLLFVIIVSIIVVSKLLTIRIYYYLYPKNRTIDSIQYWGDLWICVFITIVIICVILFLTIRILIGIL